jgi:transcriptional regulator with XRE-family HTH domain
VPVRSATSQQALDALAVRLREIRNDAELTARQVAQAAGWHESKCSRIEHARSTPSPADIRTWCAICGVPEQAADLTAALRSIESMYVEWRRMNRAGMRRLQEASLPLYERTRQFRIYEPGVIPGLFQTAEYARARMARIAEFNGLPDDLDRGLPLPARRAFGDRVDNRPLPSEDRHRLGHHQRPQRLVGGLPVHNRSAQAHRHREP